MRKGPTQQIQSQRSSLTHLSPHINQNKSQKSLKTFRKSCTNTINPAPSSNPSRKPKNTLDSKDRPKYRKNNNYDSVPAQKHNMAIPLIQSIERNCEMLRKLCKNDAAMGKRSTSQMQSYHRDPDHHRKHYESHNCSREDSQREEQGRKHDKNHKGKLNKPDINGQKPNVPKAKDATNKQEANLIQIYKFYKKTFDINMNNCQKMAMSSNNHSNNHSKSKSGSISMSNNQATYSTSISNKHSYLKDIDKERDPHKISHQELEDIEQKVPEKKSQFEQIKLMKKNKHRQQKQTDKESKELQIKHSKKRKENHSNASNNLKKSVSRNSTHFKKDSDSKQPNTKRSGERKEVKKVEKNVKQESGKAKGYHKITIEPVIINWNPEPPKINFNSNERRVQKGLLESSREPKGILKQLKCEQLIMDPFPQKRPKFLHTNTPKSIKKQVPQQAQQQVDKDRYEPNAHNKQAKPFQQSKYYVEPIPSKKEDIHALEESDSLADCEITLKQSNFLDIGDDDLNDMDF